MAIPDFQTLMLPVLRASADGEVRIGDVVEKLGSKSALTGEEQANLLPAAVISVESQCRSASQVTDLIGIGVVTQ
jgi:restriction endonuclease Mrr